MSFVRKNLYNGWLILPTKDEHVKALSKNKTKLSKFYKVGADNWETVIKCYNKKLTYNIAEKLSIPIPQTFFPENLSSIKELNLQYPCIIKPAVMHSFYSKFKKKVFVCNDEKELIKDYSLAIKVIPNEEIIIQEIIEGTSDNQYSVGILFYNGIDISSIVVKRARQHPHDFGKATTFAVSVENTEIYNLAIKILKEINYNGLCEVEFKYDKKSNSFKLLEINPRTWKWHIISLKANVNLLLNYYNILYNRPIIQDKKEINVSFRHIVTDIPSIITYFLKGIFKKYNSKKTIHAVWDKSDIKPAIFELLYLPIFILKR